MSNEQPTPPEADNDKEQYSRGRGLIAGGCMYEEGQPTDATERASFARDLQSDAFKRGWCEGWLRVAAANGDLDPEVDWLSLMKADPFEAVRRATPNDQLALAVLAGEYGGAKQAVVTPALHFFEQPIDWRPYSKRKTIAAFLKTYAATDLEVPPTYDATNEVECRGETLSRILWQGRQWAVTTYGIEARNGCYVIERDRLWDKEDAHGWVLHLAEKDWTDLADFAEALRIARRIHAKHSPRMTEGRV